MTAAAVKFAIIAPVVIIVALVVKRVLDNLELVNSVLPQ